MANKFSAGDFTGTFWTVFDGDFYVSTTGNDNNQGGPQDPFLTVAKAFDMAVNGEKIVIGPFEYVAYDSLSGSASGSGGSGLPCRFAVNVPISLPMGTPFIEGNQINDGDRILLMNQLGPAENGIYVVTPSGWQRDPAFNNSENVIGGTLVPILEGSFAQSIFQLTTLGPINVGGTHLDFTEVAVTDWGEIGGTLDDQADLSGRLNEKANKVNVLELDNQVAYTPTEDYHPATKVYVDTEVNSLTAALDRATPKGSLDCSLNPDYLPGVVGDYYYVQSGGAGKIGGASGKDVQVGDKIQCIVDNAGGDEATVGTSWIVFQGNLDKVTTTEIQAATDDEKYVTAAKSYDGWYSWLNNKIVSELNTSDKTIVGAINEVATSAGDVSKSGTPGIDQLAFWTADGIITGSASLLFDGTTLLAATDIIANDEGGESDKAISLSQLSGYAAINMGANWSLNTYSGPGAPEFAITNNTTGENVIFIDSGNRITIYDANGELGAQYADDYSSNNLGNPRWIPDKAYVDTAVAGVSGFDGTYTVEDATSDVIEIAKFNRTTSVANAADGIGGYLTIGVEDYLGNVRELQLRHTINDSQSNVSSIFEVTGADTGTNNSLLLRVEGYSSPFTESATGNIYIGSGVEYKIQTDQNTIAIGRHANTSTNVAQGANGMIYIGHDSGGSTNNRRGTNGVAIGYRTFSESIGSVAIGSQAGNSGATDNYSVAIGNSARTASDGAIAIGSSAGGFGANGNYSIAIGFEAGGSFSEGGGRGADSIAIGYRAYANNTSGIAIGDRSRSTASNAVAIGPGIANSIANSFSTWGFKVGTTYGTGITTNSDPDTNLTDAANGVIAYDSTDHEFRAFVNGAWTGLGGGGNPYVSINSLGLAASATGADAIAIGDSSEAAGAEAIVIGKGAGTGGVDNYSITIGRYTNTTMPSGLYSITIGTGAICTKNHSISLGYAASTTGINATSIGRSAVATGLGSLAIGDSADSTANYATTLGYFAQGTAIGSIGIGTRSEATSQGAIIMGYHTLSQVNSLADSFKLMWNGITGFHAGLTLGTQITVNADPDTNLTDAANGVIAYDSTDHEFRAYVNGGWDSLALASDIPSGIVDTIGTPANDQIAVFTDSNTLEGTSAITFTSPSFLVSTSGQTAIKAKTTTAATGSAFFWGENDISDRIFLGIYGSTFGGTVFGDPKANSGVVYMNSGSPGNLYIGGESTTTQIVFGTNGIKRGYIDTDGGLVFGSPTGGSQGAGTLNAIAVYDDNVLLTDFVFEQYFTGRAINPVNEYQKNYQFRPFAEALAFVKSNFHLPSIMGREEYYGSGKPSLGALASQLWETVESNFLYIAETRSEVDELRDEVEGLKARLSDTENELRGLKSLMHAG